MVKNEYRRLSRQQRQMQLDDCFGENFSEDIDSQIFEQHLHQALLEARERLARRGVLLEGGEDA